MHWPIFFLKVYDEEMGSLALLKHWSNTGGQDVTVQFSSNSLSFLKTLNGNFSHINRFKGHLNIPFNKFAFPGDIFPFLWCPAALYEAEMADGLTVIFLLCSKTHKTCFALTKIFIFFAHNSYLGLALPYYSNFIPLVVTLPVWESESGCQQIDFMRHVFAPVHRTAQSWSHVMHGKNKILSCSISHAFGKTALITMYFLV